MIDRLIATGLFRPLARVASALLLGALLLPLQPDRGLAHGVGTLDCVEPVPEDIKAPLFSGLGDASYPIITRGPDALSAQRYFDQGLTLFYAFKRPAAINAFAQAAHLDPAAPMPHWGIALAAGPGIQGGATQSCYELAVAAAAKALELAEVQLQDPNVYVFEAERELAYARALGARYRQDAEGGFHADPLAYAAEMKRTMADFPDDLEAAALTAAALMNIAPQDWWRNGAPSPEVAEARGLLRQVLARNPDHLGANHHFIYATEGSPWPEEALASAERLPALAPAAGGVRHAPSHIYRRIGAHAKATEANQTAVAAERAHLRQAVTMAPTPLRDLAHSQHSLTRSLALEGRESEAIASALALIDLALSDNGDPESEVFDEPLAEGQADYFLAAALATAAVFRRWDILEQLEKDHGISRVAVLRKLSYTAAIWAYVNLLRSIDEEGEALSQPETIEALQGFWSAVEAAPADAIHGSNQAMDLFKIANLVLLARLAEALPDETAAAVISDAKLRLAESPGLQEDLNLLDEADRKALAIALWEKAVARQDDLNDNLPSDWYYDTRESLGAALYRQGRFAEAESVFRDGLARQRGSGRLLDGLIESLHGQGKPVPAWLKAQLQEAWKNATAGPLFLNKL